MENSKLIQTIEIAIKNPGPLFDMVPRIIRDTDKRIGEIVGGSVKPPHPYWESVDIVEIYWIQYGLPVHTFEGEVASMWAPCVYEEVLPERLWGLWGELGSVLMAAIINRLKTHECQVCDVDVPHEEAHGHEVEGVWEYTCSDCYHFTPHQCAECENTTTDAALIDEWKPHAWICGDCCKTSPEGEGA